MPEQKQFSADEKLAYLAAFIDSEGWVTCKRGDNGRSKLNRRIGFTNTDKELFDLVICYAKDMGFEFAIRSRQGAKANHSARWDAYLTGGRRAYTRFSEIVPLRHVGKRQRLKDIIDQYCSVAEAGRRREKARTANTTPERRKEISQIALAAQRTKRSNAHAMVRF